MTRQGLPTVGDTLTIVRHIAAPSGAVVEAPVPTDSSVATLVSPPVITREGDSVRIAYTIAVWAPGRNDLVLPGAIVVDPRGRVDTLAPAHIGLEVRSVLPAGKAPAAIAPERPRTWLSGRDRSPLPFAFWLPLALMVIALLQWWWRRRGPAPQQPPRPVVVPVDPRRIDAWLAAGEARLALDHVEHALGDRPEFDAWRTRADASRFAPGNDAEIAGLVREVMPILTEEGQA